MSTSLSQWAREVVALLRPQRRRPQTFQRSGLTKSEAEELLDWLEIRGCTALQAIHVEGQGFVVRWQEQVPTTVGDSLLQRLKRVVSRLWGSGRR